MGRPVVLLIHRHELNAIVENANQGAHGHHEDGGKKGDTNDECSAPTLQRLLMVSLTNEVNVLRRRLAE